MQTPPHSPLRNDPRIHVGLLVGLRFGWKGSEEMRAKVIDISERGMCVRCQTALRLGSEVQIFFDQAPDNPKHYQVIWVRDAESTPHSYDTGLELRSETAEGA